MFSSRVAHSFVKRPIGRIGAPGLLALVVITSLTAGCDERSAHVPAEVERLLSDAAAGRIAEGVRIRVSGIVTDDDAERQLAFIGDAQRAIAVHTARGGLGVAAGHRVTLEARVEITRGVPCLTEPLVIDSAEATLPGTALVDADDVFDSKSIGRRVELPARVQAVAMKDGRLQLTITSHGLQLSADIRKPKRHDWRSLVGADIRLKGVVVPPNHDLGARNPTLTVATYDDVRVESVIPTSDLMLQVLTDAAAVQALTPEDAAFAHPVNVQARVTVYDPMWNVLFVQDHTAGIFVFTNSLDHPMPDCRPGDLVEIIGESGPGEFAPTIAAHSITIQKRETLPPARVVALDQLLSGGEDSQFIEITGVVRSMTKDDEDHLVLDLVHARERIPAFVPRISGQTLPSGLDVDAVVRVKAVAGAQFNTRRQMVGAQLWVPTVQQIAIESAAPPNPFELPLKTIRGLLNFEGADRAGRLARVRGTVILARDQLVYLHDDTGTLEVHTSNVQSFHSGDVVEAAGFPTTRESSPLLEDAVLRATGHGEMPKALETDAADLLKGVSGPELVKIRARVLERVSTPAEVVLALDGQGITFSAQLDRSMGKGDLGSLQNGSLVELTGVPSIQTVRQLNRLVPRGFRLLLASTEAVRVIESPPLLTGRHLGWTLGGLGLLSVLAMTWIIRLRRRVNQQTRELRHAMEVAEAMPGVNSSPP